MSLFGGYLRRRRKAKFVADYRQGFGDAMVMFHVDAKGPAKIRRWMLGLPIEYDGAYTDGVSAAVRKIEAIQRLAVRSIANDKRGTDNVSD